LIYLSKVSDERKIGIVTDLDHFFVSHQTKDSQHGSTSVVEFDGTLGEFFFFIKFIPSEVEVSVTEVTRELVTSSGHILHEGNFKETNEANDLSNSRKWDGIRTLDGSNTIGEGVEGITLGVDDSSEMNTATGDDLTQEGQHTNTSVFDFGVSKTFEVFLISITGKKT